MRVHASFAVLGVEGRFDAGEDGDATDAAIGESDRMAEKRRDGVTNMVGQAGDWGGLTGSIFHKERGNEVGGGDCRFRKKAANAGGPAEAAASEGDGKFRFHENKIIRRGWIKMKIKIRGFTMGRGQPPLPDSNR